MDCRIYYIFYAVTIRGDQQVTVYYEILMVIKISLKTVRCWELQVKNIINYL